MSGSARHGPGRSGPPRAVRLVALLAAAVAALSVSSSAVSGNPPLRYVTACGLRFCLGGTPLRVVGLNTFSLVFRPDCNPYADPDAVLRAARAAGATVVRTMLYQELVQDDGYARFDAVLAAARRNEVRLLPVLDNENPGVSDCIEHHPLRTIAWYRSGYRRPEGSHPLSYRDYVAATLRRYRDEPMIFAWTLVNEPVATDGAQCDPAFARFFEDMSAVAAQADPHHLVDLGASAPALGGWSCAHGPDRQDVLLALPGNAFVEYHDYARPPCAGRVRCLPDTVAAMLSLSRRLDRPLLVAEMGITLTESGGSRGQRAALLGAKIVRECDAGAAGVLLWQLQMDTGPGVDGYALVPGDPTLGRLAVVSCDPVAA